MNFGQAIGIIFCVCGGLLITESANAVVLTIGVLIVIMGVMILGASTYRHE